MERELNMQYRTRNGRSPQGLQRVYFTGHPEKLEYWREQIIPQILERQNCAVFYESDPEHPEDAENFETDLSRMQLIVMPVTSRFLTQDSFARRVVFAFAMQRHIPVLPILTESGLADLFNEICGDLQCLDLTAHDNTALPYGEKLTRYLNSVLIGDETAQKVRDAFDAYIFMSYRKKDRQFAQELMRLIHRNDFCRDIAIWYDEFLVPGESFSSAIQDAIKKSELFALVVTPNLLEQGNYVMRHEYPDAKGAGMKILPAELQPTDRPTLEQHFDAIPPCVDSRNTEALAASLAALLANVANPDNNCGEDPVHDFFIGLAYLGGIDVETDYFLALKLITRAAEHELPEAIQKLVDMYNNGEGVQRDYHKAIEWHRRLARVCGRLYSETPTEENGIIWLDSLWHLGDALVEVGKPEEAQPVYADMLRGAEDCLARSFDFAQRAVSTSYLKLGIICEMQGSMSQAKQFYEKSLQIDEQRATESGTVEARRDLSFSFEKLGDVLQTQGRLAEAQQYYEKSLQIAEQLAAETGTVRARRDLAVSYSKLGEICRAHGMLPEAQQYYEKSLQIAERLAAETGTFEAQQDLSACYDRLGYIWCMQDKLQKAQQCFENSLKIAEHLAEEVGTIESLHSLSVSCNNLGCFCAECGRMKEALQYFEKSLQIHKQLAAETGTVRARRALSSSYYNLGNFCRVQGRMPQAYQYYEKCLQIREQLIRMSESVEDWDYLAESHYSLGLCTENPTARTEHFTAALHILTQLVEQCPDYPEFAHRRDMVKRKLEEL